MYLFLAPPDSSPNTGVGAAIGVFMILLVIGVVTYVLHRRYGFLSSVIAHLRTIRPFGSSGGSRQFETVDDDVNPIV